MQINNLAAPAKLNLFLHITGQLPNGYHTLQSVFMLIDLCDYIDLTLLEEDQIIRTGDVIGDPDKDLCVKAARLLKEKTQTKLGVRINVKKNIPAGAGMGGGSSDAATTLWGLNKLWNLGLSRENLLELAPKLGADVPFFLLGTNAWVEGIGEKLTPIELPECQFDVVWPGVSQSTVEIFSHKDLTRDSKPVIIRNFSDALLKSEWTEWGHNDLEPIVRRVNPEVEKLFQELPNFRLTGSGSAAFARYNPKVEGVVRKKYKKWQHFLVKSLTIHPLLSA